MALFASPRLRHPSPSTWRGVGDEAFHKPLYYLFGPEQYFIVRDTNDPNSVNPYRLVPCGIAFTRLFVYSTVQFNRKPMLGAIEIRDELTNRMLSAKFESTEPVTAHELPQHLLGSRLLLPQVST